MTIKMMTGDVRDQLALLPDNSVDCIVTSPPYWGLRDYGVEGQIGCEKSFGEHLEVMVEIFRELRRVMKPTGTCWLNYGDCYATSPNGRSAADTKAVGKDDRTFRDKPFSTIGPIYPPTSKDPFRRDMGRRGGGRAPATGVLKAKDLCMLPNRLAIALQDDGWFVRSEIIWAKPNPMPESVTDRPATAHEKIFLLTKSGKYFYDALAVRTPMKDSSITRLSQNIDEQKVSTRANGGVRADRPMKAVFPFPAGLASGEGSHSTIDHNRPDKQRGHSRRHAGFNERWDSMSREEQMQGGANLKNVWTIPTKGFREAHFATFPPDIPEICIKAGTSERGVCPTCGSPWTRIVKKKFTAQGDVSGAKGVRGHKGQKPMDVSSGWSGSPRGNTSAIGAGWKPTCRHKQKPVPATVLDPFAGAGTTGLVADRIGRNSILIDLNPEYAKMTVKRIRDDAPLFVEIETPGPRGGSAPVKRPAKGKRHEPVAKNRGRRTRVRNRH